MCQYELWVYQRCFSSSPHLPHQPHRTYFRVAKCLSSPNCEPPAPRADLKSTPELPVQLRDRYCTTCYEALQNSMGSSGDSCWPCGEENWPDKRLCKGMKVIDLEGWNGMDRTVELDSNSTLIDAGARTRRLKFLARNWKGWSDWGGIDGRVFRGIS
ncbi:hypothetical protein DFP73DRAFT_52371 [Morchella snyderi]|nr:hypothetical protein DFP73DRAFT_52371 [Morchella snyderi]